MDYSFRNTSGYLYGNFNANTDASQTKGSGCMEKKVRDIPTHNDAIKNETMRVIDVGKLRFYDDEEYYEWNDKYSEPKAVKR
jgi:hypothetical protein